MSNIPWRRIGVKYTNNESYFDLIEEIDAIIDRNGTTVMCEIQGYVSGGDGPVCGTNKTSFFILPLPSSPSISMKSSWETHLLFPLSVAMSREDAKKLSAGLESGITWRQVGIKHRTTNEILIDIIESLDAIVDPKGMIVTAEVSGVVGDVRSSSSNEAYLA